MHYAHTLTHTTLLHWCTPRILRFEYNYFVCISLSIDFFRFIEFLESFVFYSRALCFVLHQINSIYFQNQQTSTHWRTKSEFVKFVLRLAARLRVRICLIRKSRLFPFASYLGLKNRS